MSQTLILVLPEIVRYLQQETNVVEVFFEEETKKLQFVVNYSFANQRALREK